MNIMEKILPEEINNDYKGYKIAVYVFIFYSILSLVRSCIHIFSSDGGAGSIAKIDLSEGGENTIFIFALWGSSQLIVAIIQFLVAFKYKTLLPVMYLLLFLEYILRTFTGNVRPLIFEVGVVTPPGGYLDKIMIPLSMVMFVLTILESKNNTLLKT